MIPDTPQNLEQFVNLCERSQEVQEAVLFDILEFAKDTLIGKELGFKNIKNLDDFRLHVKTKSWKDFAPYAQKMEDGEEDILFPGKPPYFICTSGTTGKIKHIPESKESSKLKSTITSMRIEAMAQHFPSMMAGKMFPLVNHSIEGYTSTGIPFGSASGITLTRASTSLKEKVAFPIELIDAEYNEWIDYFMIRFALCEDVRFIPGNNAGRLAQIFQKVADEADRIIEDIEKGTLYKIETLSETLQKKIKSFLSPNPQLSQKLKLEKQKYGKLLPKSYWPNLKVIACWLGGSVGRYTKDLEPFLSDGVVLFDVGYGATEGKFNIPTEPNQKAGALTIHSAFYEFREVGKEEFLLSHELEDKKSYEIFVTTYSGLYRYNMGDIIQVDGFVGTTPKIFFEQKSGDMLNLCGEKVGASSLIPIVNQAVEDIIKKQPYHWCIIPDEEQKNYHFCIELPKEIQITADTQKRIEDHLEELLKEQTLIYPIFRTQNLLHKLKVTLMKSGWQEALYKEILKDGKSTAQTKLPLVYKEIPLKDYIL